MPNSIVSGKYAGPRKLSRTLLIIAVYFLGWIAFFFLVYFWMFLKLPHW